MSAGRLTTALLLAPTLLLSPAAAARHPCCAVERADREPQAPVSHTVEIRDMAFHPTELRIRPGDTVTWINRDFVAHTATAPDSAWTSPPLARGEAWRMVADSPGIRDYVCAFHPVMDGRLLTEPLR